MNNEMTNYAVWGHKLKFGDQLCGFHISQLPPWMSLIWFSSGPVDSLVNRHKWHATTTLR